MGTAGGHSTSKLTSRRHPLRGSRPAGLAFCPGGGLPYGLSGAMDSEPTGASAGKVGPCGPILGRTGLLVGRP
jgi:hypothetical protein